MAVLFLCVQAVVLIAQVLIGTLVGYLLVLTLAARKAPKQTVISTDKPNNRFLIIIPAHNEEKLIARTLDNLFHLDYPEELFSIHVVADNCSDQTAAIASKHGAFVYERSDLVRKGKGYALQWLLETIWSKQLAHDAVVVLDADSTISANFLKVMNARIDQGERIIQAYYSVSEPGHSFTGSIRYAALALVHYLRPQGRMVLGASMGLKGNGMVFHADLIKKMVWSASITEDIDQHMALIFQGERVSFAPDALVWGEMPDTLASSESQIARWEGGRMQMARQYILPLLRGSIKERKEGHSRQAYILFDAAIEHLIPPFSVFVGLSIGFFALDLVFFLSLLIWPGGINGFGPTAMPLVWANFILGCGLLLGQIVYVLAGLRMVEAPGIIYKNLIFAPVFVVWKIWHYIRVLLGGAQRDWVRTARNKN
jgi:cellulose synthase/poly-beta-1,6-N-acetylglucosamine synthase-like glycosyltransferase